MTAEFLTGLAPRCSGTTFALTAITNDDLRCFVFAFEMPLCDNTRTPTRSLSGSTSFVMSIGDIQLCCSFFTKAPRLPTYPRLASQQSRVN